MSDYDRLTVKEYAQMQRVTDRTVRDWIRDGKIDAERTAGDKGHWRIKVRRAS
jgi:excisionase family DNA binding protein